MEFVNDIGKPTRYHEGDFDVVRTTMWSPPGCHPVGCGVKLYIDKEGKLDHVEGDENHPIMKGRLCPRCIALKDYVYNPSRVLHPMKRAPEYRGCADKWEQISWDECYDILVERVQYFTKEYGAESIAVFSGTGRSGGILCQELAHKVLRTPNACYTQSGFACYQPRSVACSHVLGAYYPEIDYAGGLEGTYDNPEWVCPEVIVVWGKEPLKSNGDGLFGHAVIDIMKRGAKLITVDPRINWLSTRSALQLRVRPGTDAAMVMAWLSVIINENLYDADFVDKWCYGFDEFAARINDPELGMTPEKAAEICEVDVEKIYAAARMYANAHPATIAWGLAFDQSTNGNQAGHALLALMSICGNVDVPGGQIIAEIPAIAGIDAEANATIKAEEAWEGDSSAFLRENPDANVEEEEDGWEGMGAELSRKAVGYDKYPLYCENIRMAQADCMFDCLLTDEPYKIHMIWIQSTNVISASCNAEPSGWYKGILRADFVVCTDVFMTPAAQGCADLFLPLSTCAEKSDVVYTHYGASPVTISATIKAMEPVGETKSDAQIIVDLGNRLGSPKIAGKYRDGEDFLGQTRADKADGRTFDELCEIGTFQRGVNYRKYEKGLLRPDRKMGFLTNTGRIELYATTYARYGEDPLPYYREPDFSPRHTEDPRTEKYPFVLTTGARVYAFFHSEHRQIPRLRELNPNALLDINPEDAKELGIHAGQWVEIENEFGKAKFKANVSPIVRRGTVHAQHGWWFPEQEASAPSLYGVWQSNVNDLIPNHHNSILGYGAPHKCMTCNVKPLDESYDTDMSLVWEKFGELVD